MNRRQILIQVVLFLTCVLFFSSCGRIGDSTLAIFDGGDVQTDEYIEYFLSSTKYKKDVMPDEENLKHIVALKAMEKMAVLEAIEQGIENDSLYIESVENNLRKTLFFRYMRREIIDTVINDSLIQVFYDNFSPQYHMSYIMRPVVSSSTPDFEKSQKDTIDYVYKLLQAGSDFKDLAARYSQDITSNQKGGSLGFVIRESMGDAALRAAMDTLKDLTWSTPIRGFEGYYILYKGERRDVAIPPIEEIRDKIWQTLYRTRKHDIRRELDKRFKYLAMKYKFNEEEEQIAEIIKKSGGSKGTSLLAELNFDALKDEDMGRAIATYDGGEVKLYELFEEKNRKPSNRLEFNERFETICHRHLLAKHAMELGYENEPDIKEKMTDVKESLLRSFLYKRNVIDIADARLAAIEEQERLSGVQENPDEFRRVTLQRSVKEDLEAEIKQKYNFKFVTNNFKSALKRAEKKKIEQNSQSN